MSCGIYLIVNLITNKFYVGSAIDIEARWRTHNYDLNKNQHHSPRLQNAYNKYGANNFSCVVLEETLPETRIVREQFWLNYTDCCNRNKGYNVCSKAGATTGYKHTEENKQLMRKLKLGGKLSLSHVEKIKLSIKKIYKWPCVEGSECECSACNTKRNKLRKAWRRKRKAEGKKVT